MAQQTVRVKIGCSDYGLPLSVISVGWDTVISIKRDSDSVNFIYEPKSEFFISAAALPKATWSLIKAGAPFDTLIDMDNGCWTFQVSVEVFCSGAWSEEWAGQFTSTEWTINRDQRYVKVKPKQDSKPECIKKSWNEIKNLFALPDEITVKPYTTGYDIHEEGVAGTTPCADLTAPIVDQFCYDQLIQNVSTTDTGTLIYLCTFLYHRQLGFGTCAGSTPVPPDTVDDWNLLEDHCPIGSPIYYKCPTNDRVPYQFQHGRLLADVFEYLASELDCGLTIVSDFLNINPDDTHPANTAYDAAILYLSYLVVFQKSDIKRFDATNPSEAPAWGMKLKDLLDDLSLMFNANWRILGDVLRFEHVSYWEETAGADYTDRYYTRELQRDNSDTPRITRFKYRDEQCTDYFKGFPITIYCGEGEAEKRVSLFSCDIGFMIDSDNAESVGDDGWVLMSCTLDGGEYRNIDSNRPLSWRELHEKYHVYEMAGAGEINGTEATPQSLKKVRKQPEFTVHLGCEETFDPTKYITTSMGNARIENADKNLAQKTLSLSVKY